MYVSIAWVLGGVSMNERYFPECKYLELNMEDTIPSFGPIPTSTWTYQTSMYYVCHVSGIFRFCSFTIFPSTTLVTTEPPYSSYDSKRLLLGPSAELPSAHSHAQNKNEAWEKGNPRLATLEGAKTAVRT